MFLPDDHHLFLPLSCLLQDYIPDAHMLRNQHRAEVQHLFADLLLGRRVDRLHYLLQLFHVVLAVSDPSPQPHAPSCAPPSSGTYRDP